MTINKLHYVNIHTLLHGLHYEGIVKIISGITSELSGAPPPKAYDSVVELNAVKNDDTIQDSSETDMKIIAKGDSV